CQRRVARSNHQKPRNEKDVAPDIAQTAFTESYLQHDRYEHNECAEKEEDADAAHRRNLARCREQREEMSSQMLRRRKGPIQLGPARAPKQARANAHPEPCGRRSPVRRRQAQDCWSAHAGRHRATGPWQNPLPKSTRTRPKEPNFWPCALPISLPAVYRST